MIKAVIAVVALMGSVFSAQAAPNLSDQVKLVTKLYHEFAWEAILAGPCPAGQSLLESSPRTLGRYFTRGLTELLLLDRKRADRTHEVGNLDFCPIWASQDPAATDLTIIQGTKPELVEVRFTYPGNGQKIHLSYQLAPTLMGWRIADITYDGGYTLRNILLGSGSKAPHSPKIR